MATVTQPTHQVKPSVRAGVLLAAYEMAPELFVPTTKRELLATLGAGVTQAYAHRNRLLAYLNQRDERPCRQAEQDAERAQRQCAEAVVAYSARHPGARVRHGARSWYADDFRRFVVGLKSPGHAGHDLTVPELAEATGVPLGTLKGWLRRVAPGTQSAQPPSPCSSAQPTGSAADTSVSPADRATRDADAVAGGHRPPPAPTEAASSSPGDRATHEADAAGGAHRPPPAPTETAGSSLPDGPPSHARARPRPGSAPPRPSDAAASGPTTAPDGPRADDPAHDAKPDADPKIPSHLAADARVATLMHAYMHWHGTLSSFCRHVREHLRLPWGRTHITTLLQAAELYPCRPRRARRPLEHRGTFRRLFPGAHWVGDGTTLALTLNGRRYLFNAELMVDVATNAIVGVQISDVEDAQAVCDAFDHGEQSTGGRPILLSLDNKPSNHCPKVAAHIESTTLVHSTPYRGQAKAPVEGTFGLLSQTAPPLCVDGDSPRQLARSVAELVLKTWCWARNRRPRKRLANRCPADAYGDAQPTEAERDAARRWAAELNRRYERFCTSRQRRAHPAHLTLLRDALPQLGIDDPDDRLATSLARYSYEAITFGLALLRSKQQCGTLEHIDNPARYLAAVIARNQTALELESLAQHLLELRCAHRDLTVAELQQHATELRARHQPADRPAAFVDAALQADALVDFRFYLRQATEALAQLDPATIEALYVHLARRISVSHRTPTSRRRALLDAISRVVAAHTA